MAKKVTTTKEVAPRAMATFVCDNYAEQRFKVTSEISPRGTRRTVEERVLIKSVRCTSKAVATKGAARVHLIKH